MTSSRLAALLVTVLLAPAQVEVQTQTQEWPQFRGPTGQGHSPETGLPAEWSETRNVAWKIPVAGIGWSSPAVGGGLVWLTTAVEVPGVGRSRAGLSLRALAFDTATGRERVNVEVFKINAGKNIHPKNSHASPTPVLDGDRVYVHYGAEGTAAMASDGRVLWKTQLPYESQHGNGGSPVLYRDLLIINCDGNGGEAYVAALDTKTGKARWKTNRRPPADQAYSTPLVITVDGRDQLISVGAYRAAAYDPLTGDEIWRVGYNDGFSNVPRPVFGHGLVFIATGFNQPTMIAVRPDGRGDVTRTHLVWTISRGAPFTPSPLLVGDDLYIPNDTGILSLADAKSGRLIWQQRLGGNYSASPVFADGRIYFQSEEGVTTVIAPGREFKKLASNTLDGGMFASMAIADRSIFIRTDRHLYRISRREP